MLIRCMALFLCGLLVACGTRAAPVDLPPPTLILPSTATPASPLAAWLRQFTAPYPQGNWCDQTVSRQPVDEYNNGLVQALAHLLADPRAENLPPHELARIYADGALISPASMALARGADTVLAALPTYRTRCVEGSHYIPSITRLVLFDHHQHFWLVRQTVTSAETGTFVKTPGAMQWAGDRWVVLLNDVNTLCLTCVEVIHIMLNEGTWVAASVLTNSTDNQSYFAPALRLIDGYQTIGLTHFRYDPPPCTFDTGTQARYAWTINIIERIYRWFGTAYIPVEKHILETRVILYAGEHRETYERLLDWQPHCVS